MIPTDLPFFKMDFKGFVNWLNVPPTSCLLAKNKSVTIIYVPSGLDFAILKGR